MNNTESVDGKFRKVSSVEISSGFKDLRKCEMALRRLLRSILKDSEGLHWLSIRRKLPTTFSLSVEVSGETSFCLSTSVFLKPIVAFPEIHA